MTAPLTDRCAIVLVEPQDPINIGSVVRACANMDVRDIRLLRPARPDFEAMLVSAPGLREFASDAVRTVDAWEDAVEGVHTTIALTARGRTERHQRYRIDECVEALAAHPERTMAFVFGREDSGLPNEIVDRCHGYATIRTGDHRSLNLAQAVMVVVHSVFAAAPVAEPMRAPRVEHPPAPADAVERMTQQAESALEAIGFFKGDQRANVIRTLRRVWSKAELDQQELATLWGIFKETEIAARAGRIDVPNGHK